MIQLQVINYILSSGDSSFIVVNNLKKEYFSEYTNEFTFIKNHINTYGNVPDTTSFLSVFPEFEVLDITESPAFLLDELMKDYKTRKMAETFNTVKNLLMSGKIEEAAAVYKRGAEALSSDIALSCTDLFQDFSRYDEYLNRAENVKKYYIPTGFKELDKIMFGIDREEELGVIMARTNMGKSYITLKMAVASAAQGLNVGLYSGEMTAGKVGYRMDSMISTINCGSLMHGNINVQNEYKKYIDGLREKFPDASLKVLTPADVSGNIGVDVMKAFIEKYNLDILYIDQLSLLDDDRHGRTREERQSNIIIDLKRLQTQKKIPIICVAQQNREKNDDGSIDTTQIAGSDDIGKYATFVLAISRDKKDKDIMTIEVTKCRDGKAGSKIKYLTDLSTGLFEYIPEEDDNSTDDEEKSSYDGGGDTF